MCIFCKIVNGEIPCYRLYEDETVLAFLDISQATIGHTLVIPKKHFPDAYALDEDTASKVFVAGIKIAKRLKEVLPLEGLNILNNNGPVAGQSVNHFHLHLLPRYQNDGLNIQFSSNKIDPEEFSRLVQKISF
ncbi:MAG: HIT family protein [Acholeplasmataceae bacterium]|jgi:histidine triad (HIT) family protein|nr:HIT family protein [Acholeplasmataceae bacterium]